MEVCGKSELKVDPKGRVFLPRHWLEIRDEAAGATTRVDQLWLTPGLGGCLWLLDKPEFQRMQRRLRSADVGDQRLRRAQRFFFENTEELRVDAQCRILIPKPQLEAAGIADSVRMIGMGRRIEIWAPDRHAADLAAAGAEPVQDLEAVLSAGDTTRPWDGPP